MKDKLRGVAVVLVVLLVSGGVWAASDQREEKGWGRALQSYLTSSTRMKVNEMFCTGVERSTMVSQADIDLKSEYMSHFNLSFSVDGYLPLYSATPSTTLWPTTGLKLPTSSKTKPKDSLSSSAHLLWDLCCCSSSCPSWPVAAAVPTAVPQSAVVRTMSSSTASASCSGRV